MLTCVYHPIDGKIVVQADEAERLMETGVWFDCPKKAKDYRNKVEEEIKQESAVEQNLVEEQEVVPTKRKKKEQSHERQ
ncbi:TPA: hypothetical protein ACPSKZ_000679 [Legionella anisa]|uniref:hypothetical protein n=1 Tax=Legionella anisa TaxID=28082 RepID=UPI002243C299|nr:hypothetical protein [Legionella anisa]MCW8425623.1 hypothetical protein [Legionella anisa]MCW8448948.1 hypothetical protein [Legionella anisa]